MNDLAPRFASRWIAFVTFGWVLATSLLLAKMAATDIPYYDPWNNEGQWLYPSWLEGTLSFSDLFRPIGEHRAAWACLLNLFLFEVNGQWDPLVQIVVLCLLRALCAGGLAYQLCRGFSVRGRWACALGVGIAFLPHLAWQTVLWGVHSTDFAVGFSWLTFALLSGQTLSLGRTLAGVAAGTAAMFSMASGELVPIALFGLLALRAAESRTLRAVQWRELGAAGLLFLIAIALHREASADLGFKSRSLTQVFVGAARAFAWPHVGSPLAGLVLNLPIFWLVGARLCRRRSPVAGENFVVLLWGWSFAIALAIGWARGGGAELLVGVPSRYVDFLVGLPVANGWAIAVLWRETASSRKHRTALIAGGWAMFLFIGWIGLSVEIITRLILPRSRDVEAPVRLVRAYQLTGEATVFAGQPRLYVPHPDLASVRAVLTDPRMQGHLPPSLQPEKPLGPLSRAVRWLLGRGSDKQ